MVVRHALFFTAGAIVVILMLPLASAGSCISEMDLLVGLETARFDMQQMFADEDAAELRTLVDQGVGDADGQISDEEVTAWESALSGRSEASVTACLDAWSDFMGGFVRFDGKVPQRLEGFRASMDLQESRSATANDPLLLRFSGTLRYEGDAAEAEVVIVPEAFEGLSEMIECIAPDRIDSNFAQNPCGDTRSDPLPTMRRLEIRPADGTRIVQDTIEPAVARDAFDKTAILMTDFVAEDALTDVRFSVVADDDDGFAWVWIATGAAGLTGLVVLFKAGGQRGRFRFWWLLSVFGFTRIRRETALVHRRRENILAAIVSEPGVHLGALQRGLGMATGTLVHHLRVLERTGLVETRRRSNRVHFVPSGYRGAIEASQSVLQQRLLETVRTSPGLSQSELSERLAQPRNTVAYNVRRLIEDDQIEVRREGRVVRHFVVD